MIFAEINKKKALVMLTLNYINNENHRTYRICLETDLLGDLVIAKFYGSAVCRLGGRKLEAVPDLQTGLNAFMAEHKKRTRHHYEVIDV